MGFMIWTLVERDRWARRVDFGGPSGPAVPPIANSKVQFSKGVGITCFYDLPLLNGSGYSIN
jgi:hypothetical protein